MSTGGLRTKLVHAWSYRRFGDDERRMSTMKNQRGMGSIYLRGSIFYIKYHHNGKPQRESSHSKKRKDAERLLKQRQGEIVSGKYVGVGPEKICLSALFEMVIDDYIEHERHDLYTCRRRISKHLSPVLGDVRAADFGSEHVRKYIRGRKTAKPKPANATINRELAIIRRAFHLAAACNPAKVSRIPFIEELPEGNVRQGFLEHAQYLGLRDELPDYARLALVIAYHCGNRKGELMQLEWSMVDLKAREIRIPGHMTKNKQPKRSRSMARCCTGSTWQKKSATPSIRIASG